MDYWALVYKPAETPNAAFRTQELVPHPLLVKLWVPIDPGISDNF